MRRRRQPQHVDAAVVAAVAVGGALGAAARYASALLWPTATGRFPTTTLLVNVVGCALIGILLVLVTDVWAGRRLVRPFLGTGVLGGFTTFSTYAVDTVQLLAAGRWATAFAYAVGTLAGAVLAVAVAASLTRRAVTRRLL
ncbi:MAG TPA: fluoride efflux transporter CrcB [Intrasporangium sp.]|uniref:fluoride efflux transporter CrcB n=1 Tax=Intrasporangium sp. TaxID=1925024 RepID=UPI002D78AC0A|nr:fluoride efflux transporter CrcB [Intrasporangium sp.]HET7398190.1 fluoride efflux transporter CrcB [Intrasporangium sp.]